MEHGLGLEVYIDSSVRLVYDAEVHMGFFATEGIPAAPGHTPHSARLRWSEATPRLGSRMTRRGQTPALELRCLGHWNVSVAGHRKLQTWH